MKPPRSFSLSEVNLPELDLDRPAADQIFNAVKVAILRMELPPGCLVSENEIGQKVGASRTPVREAFTRLRQDGLIVTRPSRGNFVSTLSEQRIREAQFLREGLELHNMRQLCEIGLSKTNQASLKEILAQQEACISKPDDIAFQTHDDRFHETLASATGFTRACTLLQREKVVLDRLRILSLSDAKRKTQLLKDHRAIFEAVVAKDVTRAVLTMQHHLRAVLSELSSRIQANRSYFT